MRNVLAIRNVWNGMLAFRWLFPALLAASLFAQGQQEPAKPEATVEKPITVSVDVVVAPVSVVDRNGDNVDGLRPDQFHLFDNGKEQDIHVDVAFPPISLVIAVEANDRVESVLPQIQKIGAMIEPLVIGDQGEAALIAFDSRIRVMQEFTSDSSKITAALKKIHAGSSQNRMIDAVEEGVRLLSSRPRNRRRIILLVSETRDRSSEARARETLIRAQLANVSIYTVDISRVVTSIMARQDPGYIDNRPPAMTPLPPGVPATPNTVMQTTGSLGGSAEFIPMMVEVFKDAKAIFKQNPSEVFTRGTGGEQFGFMRQRGLEEAIERLGADLHSQYLIAYNPNNKDEGGFHEITVEVAGRRDVKIRTRPGYWLGAK
ncbi:MAG TPA: VWA domain-containing protein [Bryobacteraceae bacterium]|nr:VWA domain-containing protein [Bryobacteraceae bacterium]